MKEGGNPEIKVINFLSKFCFLGKKSLQILQFDLIWLLIFILFILSIKSLKNYHRIFLVLHVMISETDVNEIQRGKLHIMTG